MIAVTSIINPAGNNGLEAYPLRREPLTVVFTVFVVMDDFVCVCDSRTTCCCTAKLSRLACIVFGGGDVNYPVGG